MSDMLEKVTPDHPDVKALEETNPELHAMLVEHCNKFATHILNYKLNPPCSIDEPPKHDRHDPFVRTEAKINRNDPCPHCLAEGITIKFKKCQLHYKS